jgi:hypothetical protein
VVFLSFPSFEIGSLYVAKLQRQFNLLDLRRSQNSALSRRPRFVADPRPVDRCSGPERDNSLGFSEFALDRLVEALADRDVAVPPDRPLERFKRSGQFRRFFYICSRVADEDIRHLDSYAAIRPFRPISQDRPQARKGTSESSSAPSRRMHALAKRR